MKKLLLLLAALTLLSCSNNDDGCKCDAMYEPFEDPVVIPDTPIDCETGKPLKPTYPEAMFFIKCK
ncbi:hypothetical protein [Flavobacterium enshiense]|uniref:hypothetical protein n=1 Tax=Flavobacterium enshiense TaxID=1341165 RepID=UPI000A6D7764|nr:hypothetical protein [Flavobacterium enshiense]